MDSAIQDSFGGDPLGDFDGDGIPNYADQWNGTGSTSPFAGQNGTHESLTGDSLGDFDGDGVPNYADNWHGTGSESPFAEQNNTHESMTGDSLGDFDGDGIPNYADSWNGQGAESPHLGAASHGGVDNSSFFDFVEHEIDTDSIEPTISDDYDSWCEQEDMNSCAIAAQKSVIHAITGEEVPESVLADFAERSKWYSPKYGTPANSVGNLLEVCNIPVERSYETTYEDLQGALQNGEKIIVAVDANEVYSEATDLFGNPLELEDKGHAVCVTGFDRDQSGDLHVILNDPGHIDGAGVYVPIDRFENAWDDFGHYAVITNTRGLQYA